MYAYMVTHLENRIAISASRMVRSASNDKSNYFERSDDEINSTSIYFWRARRS